VFLICLEIVCGWGYDQLTNQKQMASFCENLSENEVKESGSFLTDKASANFSQVSFPLRFSLLVIWICRPTAALYRFSISTVVTAMLSYTRWRFSSIQISLPFPFIVIQKYQGPQTTVTFYLICVSLHTDR
jgi:hypothetical protein